MTPDTIPSQEVDILVLGAGLAGMRAAWAALEQAPGSRVMVVRPGRGPSGSSFSNVNNMLGMQVCPSPEDRDALVEDVRAVAGKAHLDSSLVRAMAEDSRQRYNDLAGLGIEFKNDSTGAPQKFPGCFSPHSRRAVVFTKLGRIHHRFVDKVKALGGGFYTGYTVNDLLVDEDRVCGALLYSEREKRFLALRSRAVIMALGGPAPLFAYNQAGPKNPGFALAMLQRAGAKIVNQGFMQFMWAEAETRRFWSILRLGLDGSRVRLRNGEETALADELRNLTDSRSTHCPYGHGLDDARLDGFLIDQIGPDGVVHVLDPTDGWLRVAPMAHAGNGGALIDASGRTSVDGLYACGECAGGMHGANRVGGAMVLATQVFGERAGRHAASRLKTLPQSSDKTITGLVIRHLQNKATDDAEYARQRHWLAWTLQRSVPGSATRELDSSLHETLRHRRRARDWRSGLALETGITLLEAFAANG